MENLIGPHVWSGFRVISLTGGSDVVLIVGGKQAGHLNPIVVGVFGKLTQEGKLVD